MSIDFSSINDKLAEIQEIINKQPNTHMNNNEKLNSLINKLVELKTETDHLKGFLFREGSDYYVKPIEVYSGNAKEAGKFWLEESHVDSVKFAESPKLMKVSMKSWHYKLMKWILGSNVPTPKTMQNGCPYFWLLIFCLLVAPFKVAFQGLLLFISAFPTLFYYVIEAIAKVWIRFVPEESAYGIEDRAGYRYEYKSAPVIARKYFSHNRVTFIDAYIKIKYGVSKENQQEYAKIMALLKERAEKAIVAREAERAKRDALYAERKKEQDARELVLWNKQQERKRKSKERWAPFNKRMEKIGDGIAAIMEFDYKNSPIIKRTKQFIGFIISALVLAVTVMVVIAVTWVLINVVDGIGWLFVNYSKYMLYGVIGLTALAAVVGLCYLIFNWIQTAIGKLKFGKKSWYIKYGIYPIIYAIKYVILGLYNLIYYVLYVPLKFVFYRVLWQIFLVNIGLFLWGLGKAFGGILIGSMGIFGQYFGASKKDYCPGLQWTDVTDEYK